VLRKLLLLLLLVVVVLGLRQMSRGYVRLSRVAQSGALVAHGRLEDFVFHGELDDL
jgi:hypothetical protein